MTAVSEKFLGEGFKMPFIDNGDFVRSVGLATLHAAHLDNEINEVINRIEKISPFKNKKQMKRYRVSFQVEELEKKIEEIQENLHSSFSKEDFSYAMKKYIEPLLQNLKYAKIVIDEFNNLKHSPHWGIDDRMDCALQDSTTHGERTITSKDILELINNIDDLRAYFRSVQNFDLERLLLSFAQKKLIK